MNFSPCLDQIKDLQDQILAKRPLSPKESQQLKEYYRVGLTYSSNALEGNTLTETETKVVLEDGITIAGKPMKDHLEATGHSKAFDLMFDMAKKDTIHLEDIYTIHSAFYSGIDDDNAGQLRTDKVIITGSTHTFPPPEKLDALMKEFGTTLSPETNEHPVIFAARLHQGLVHIHPFVDGNGRIARLLMNLALLKSQYPVTIIPPVLRAPYIDSLEASHHGNSDPFYTLIQNMVLEAQKDWLRVTK